VSKYLDECATVVLSRNLAGGFNQAFRVNQTKSAVTEKQPDSKYKNISLFSMDIRGFAAIRLSNFDSQ